VEHGNEGIYIAAGTGNVLHHNSLVRNNNGGVQGYDGGLNQWDDGSRGNYWSDYFVRYPAATHNGYVWNTPYDMTGGAGDKDRYPLVRGFFGLSVRNPIRINSNSEFTFINGVSNPTAAERP